MKSGGDALIKGIKPIALEEQKIQSNNIEKEVGWRFVEHNSKEVATRKDTRDYTNFLK